MIIRARTVVTMDGPVVDDGAVAVSGRKIEWVGRWRERSRDLGGEVLDLGERALLPGLINAHCHLDYTMLRGAIPRPSSFTDWIRAINAQKAHLTAADYLQAIETGLAEAASFGTTTLVNLQAFPDLLGTMRRPPLRTWWLAEMIDVRAGESPAEVYAKLAETFAQRGDWLGGVGLAPHAPFTASARLYAEAAEMSARHDAPLTTHLAESREEMQMFRDGSGALFEFMTEIGRPMDDCGRGSPLALMLERGLLGEDWIIAHLNELTPGDFQLLESAPKFHIAHCPRSQAYFGHSRFAATKLRDLGFNICLATDSLASNDDLSLFAEMRQMSAVEPGFSPRELFEMVTVNAAAALRQNGSLGRIRPGFQADLIAVPHATPTRDTLSASLRFEGKVPWMMLDGTAVPKG